MLGRDTNWRQGHTLSADAAARLGLVQSGGTNCTAVVISHDCDIPHQAEDYVEVIVADVVTSGVADPQLLGAKNPRRLHLQYRAGDSAALVLELRHSGRCDIEKSAFAAHAGEPAAHVLADRGKRALKQWLAARYARPAFPNAFESHLRKRVGGKSVKDRIAKIMAEVKEPVIGLFLDMGRFRGIDPPEGEPYELIIAVVYEAAHGPTARASAGQAAAELRDIFERAYGPAETATQIALQACEAVADTHLSLADIKRMDQWQLEYLSLRGDNGGGFIPIGAIPP